MLYCNWVWRVSSHFRDNGPHTYWGHDTDLSGSRDIIVHVTNRFALYHFLLVTRWNWFSIFNGTVFEIIFGQKNPVRWHIQKERKKETHRKWFYILPYALYCIGWQTIIGEGGQRPPGRAPRLLVVWCMFADDTNSPANCTDLVRAQLWWQYHSNIGPWGFVVVNSRCCNAA